MTQHYQDNLGGWHVLDDVSFEYLLAENNPSKTFMAKTQAEYDAAHVPPAPTLAEVQTTQLALIESAYQQANTQPIAYMGTIFQADQNSQSLMAAVITACGGSLPTGFAWFDINNAPVTMTFAQLQGLAGTILLRGQPLFTHKQTQKAAIRAALDIPTVQAVIW